MRFGLVTLPKGGIDIDECLDSAEEYGCSQPYGVSEGNFNQLRTCCPHAEQVLLKQSGERKDEKLIY